jgi:hypothetical protein
MLLSFLTIKAQTKNIGECTLQYHIIQMDNADTIGVKWVYVKGDQCKTTIHTSQLVQSLYFNTQSKTATITKDIGESHFIQEVLYPPIEQPTLVSMKELPSDTLVQFLGYTCKQVELKWSDGVIYQIWYTPEIMTTVSSFEIAFKEVGGLVLCYNVIPVAGNTIQYKASSIDFSPIALSQFIINKDQFQIIE